MKRTLEQEWESIISEEGFSFDDGSLENTPELSYSSCGSESEISFPNLAEVQNQSSKIMDSRNDTHVTEAIRQLNDVVQRLEKKVDNMQNSLTDLIKRSSIKSCLHCDPSPIKNIVSQIAQKNLSKCSKNSKKSKTLTWRSGLGLPVNNVEDMDNVNQKLINTEYLTEFRTLLRHCSARGIGLNEKLKIILKEALGSHIGGLYNLSGTCGKRSIEKTELFIVIQNYMMEIYGATNETRRAVKLVFHRFLKNQQDRITKAAKCKNSENSTPADEKIVEQAAGVSSVDGSDHNIRSVPSRSNFISGKKVPVKDSFKCNFCDESFCNELLLKQHACNYTDNHDQIEDELDDSPENSYERDLQKYFLYDTVAWVNDDASHSPLLTNGNDLLQREQILKIECDEDVMKIENHMEKVHNRNISVFEIKKEKDNLNERNMFSDDSVLESIENESSDD